jgi:hypothetical protein
LEKEVEKVEKQMQEKPEDMKLIENYTTLLEQLNNI